MKCHTNLKRFGLCSNISTINLFVINMLTYVYLLYNIAAVFHVVYLQIIFLMKVCIDFLHRDSSVSYFSLKFEFWPLCFPFCAQFSCIHYAALAIETILNENMYVYKFAIILWDENNNKLQKWHLNMRDARDGSFVSMLLIWWHNENTWSSYLWYDVKMETRKQ